METYENENTVVQKLWDAANVVLREKYIAIQVYLKKKTLKQPNLTPEGAGKRTKNKA